MEASLQIVIILIIAIIILTIVVFTNCESPLPIISETVT